MLSRPSYGLTIVHKSPVCQSTIFLRTGALNFIQVHTQLKTFKSFSKWIPYSGKFLLVQIFANSPPNPPGKNLISRRPACCTRTRTRCQMRHFRGCYFRASASVREKREILHHAKISRYTVCAVSHHGLCQICRKRWPLTEHQWSSPGLEETEAMDSKCYVRNYYVCVSVCVGQTPSTPTHSVLRMLSI